MAKSDELTACIPSFPIMPTPMCPALIMATSFAPSPIARQQASGTELRMRLSICAFWSFLALAATTDREAEPTEAITSGQRVPRYSMAYELPRSY